MQTPPPFHGYEGQPSPQKPKSNVAIIIFAILGVLLVCCGLPLGVAGYFGFKGFKGAMAIGGCMANVSEMQQALHKYSADHNGKMPNANTWQTDLGKYFTVNKDAEGAPIKFWKPGGEWSCEEGTQKTGFMFNQDLSEKKVTDVKKNNPDAIAIFETKTVAFNQVGKYAPLPFAESPKIFGDFTDKRRGWLLVSPDANDIYIQDKSGHLQRFNLNDSRGKGNGFNFNIDSNSDSSGSNDSNSSKDDNSN